MAERGAEVRERARAALPPAGRGRRRTAHGNGAAGLRGRRGTGHRHGAGRDGTEQRVLNTQGLLSVLNKARR